MIVLSLFDGMSGGHIALRELNIKVDQYYSSEIDKYAQIVTKKNFPNTLFLGDITDWRNWSLPPIDLILAGSPCQGFSIAGKKLNFQDPRSKLFFVFADILKHYKPKWFLLENVVMESQHQNVISEILGDIYPENVQQKEFFTTGKLKPIQINSALLSPQNRERLYWTNIPNIKQPTHTGLFLKDVIEHGVIEERITNNKNKMTITNHNGCVFWNNIKQQTGCLRIGTTTNLKGPDSIKRVYSEHGKSPTVLTMQGGNKEPKVAVSIQSNSRVGLKCVGALNHIKKWIDDDKNLPSRFSQGERIYSINGKSPTLCSSLGGTAGPGNALICDDEQSLRWRKLIPVECERLQTIPTIKTNLIIVADKNQVKNYLQLIDSNQTLLKTDSILVKQNKQIIDNCFNCFSSENVEDEIEFPLFNYGKLQTPINHSQFFIRILEGQLVYCDTNKLSNVIPTIKSIKTKTTIPLDILTQNTREILVDIAKNKTISLQHLNNVDSTQLIIFLHYFFKKIISQYSWDTNKKLKISLFFENGYTNFVSNSQRYKMIGNGWTIEIIKHILKNMTTINN